ncbi:hypothetical protein Tco_0519380 [Tanacetum coccineum]
MDTLSKVSEYLNNLKDFLDDGDSLEAKKVKVEKSKKELKMFKALEHKSVVVESKKHRVVVFTKAPLCAFSKPFMRFSTPCGVDGQGAWDAESDMVNSHNYITEEMFDKLGFVRVDYGYANKGEPLVIFGRDFLVTTKSKVDFGMGEMRIDLIMLEEERDIDDLLVELVENMEEVGSSNRELVKMGKTSRMKGHNVNKLTPPPQPKIEEIPPLQSIAPKPVYHPLSQKQKEKFKEALEKNYKELEVSKPILKVFKIYMTYRKKLNEVMMGRARLSNNEFGEEDKMRIVEHGLPKKMCDPRNFVLPIRVNAAIQMNALADTGASVSVLPFSLYKNLGLRYPRPYHFNLTMANNTQAKAIREVRNVSIQISYQVYLVDFLVLDILVDKELPLLLGRPFLRTCGAVIDMGRGTMSIDDGVICHTYFLKPRAKAYLENFERIDEDGKLDKIATLHDEGLKNLLQTVETASEFHATPSGHQSDGVKILAMVLKHSRHKETLEDLASQDKDDYSTCDEITLESLTEEQFECFIEYYRENYSKDYKSDLENLNEVYKMMNGRVEYPITQNASPSEIKEPYEPSPRMYLYEQPSCLGSTFVGETLSKSDQIHQTFEKSSMEITLMVKMPKCMSWLAYDEHIDDLDMMAEVDETIGILIEVEPLDHMKLEELGSNTCSHGLCPNSREFPNVDKPEPQPLLNLPFLDVNLGYKRGTDPSINPYSPGSFRMKSLNLVNEVVYHSPVDFTLGIVVLVLDLQVIFDKEKPRNS